MDFQHKELQDFTVGDWLDAKTGMNASSFRKKIRMAAAGGIEVPAVVLSGRSPCILFEDRSGNDFALFERVKDTEALKRFNQGVKAWAEKVSAELQSSAERSFGHRDVRYVNALQPRLSESIRPNIRFDKQYMLETRSVGFTLARHGVHLHYGSGTGEAGGQGSRWTDRYGRLKKTHPESIGKAGTGRREAEHWFNSVIERHAEELADILAEYSLDLTVNIAAAMLPF